MCVYVRIEFKSLKKFHNKRKSGSSLTKKSQEYFYINKLQGIIMINGHFLYLQSHEFSKEPSIQMIANSIDSNLSAVAGEQCKIDLEKFLDENLKSI
jgi:hypothetical protein